VQDRRSDWRSVIGRMFIRY